MPLETRRVLLGHRNGDITTLYSAPEIAELLNGAESVRKTQSDKTPALTVLNAEASAQTRVN